MRGRVGGPGNGVAANLPTYVKNPQVMAVAPGSAAERAGILPGDVLQTIDGLSVLSSQGTERMARAAAGERVQLGFERHGKPMSFILELGAPSLSARGATKVMSDYVAINGQLHGDLKAEIWSDQPIYAFPDSVTGTVTF
jgi:regulator of sigma E protease